MAERVRRTGGSLRERLWGNAAVGGTERRLAPRAILWNAYLGRISEASGDRPWYLGRSTMLNRLPFTMGQVKIQMRVALPFKPIAVRLRERAEAIASVARYV